jgi:hypothetical protein
MLKQLSFVAVLGLPLSIAALARPALAQEFAHDPSGLCNLHNLSGYAVVDASGNLVMLPRYCQTLQAIEASGENPFWQAFLAAADREAVAFAYTLGQKQVITYGGTICPFLQDGGSLDELRQIQSGGELPPSFEVAITLAAIHTHCPTYQSEIGR